MLKVNSKACCLIANTVLVNELYALSTDDGFTKLEANGLKVYDESNIERLIAGWWMDGAIKRFGLNVKASDGATVLLDDRGLLQTWQEGRTDNVDNLNPLALHIYLPPSTRSVKKAILRFKLLAFRAYEKSALSGGGVTSGPSSTSSSSSSGSHRHMLFDFWGGDGNYTDYTGYAGSHSHGIGSVSLMKYSTQYSWDTTIGHNHGIPSGSQIGITSGSASYSSEGSHYHTYETAYLLTFKALINPSGPTYGYVGLAVSY